RAARESGRSGQLLLQPRLDLAALRDELLLEALEREPARAHELELRRDVVQRLVQDLGTTAAGGAGVPLAAQRGARVLGLDDRLQLLERHAEQLAQADQLEEALDVLVHVAAVLSLRPPARPVQQAELLVVADRPSRRPRALGDLTDSHAASVSNLT